MKDSIGVGVSKDDNFKKQISALIGVGLAANADGKSEHSEKRLRTGSFF
jgi:predicted component of type VI protein secretion system